MPEVETIVRDLKKKVLGRTFIDVWTDFKKIVHLRQGFGGQVKKPDSFKEFKKKIKGKKIKKIWRRGKNIIIDLSGNLSLLIHQKLTGHLLLGHWGLEGGSWKPIKSGPLEDPMNRFLRLIFWLDDKKQLALSDLRKFAKVELWESGQLRQSPDLKSLGPEPLEKSFTFQKFEEIIKRKKGKIKPVLMDQKTIVGIGNIYSDEILWRAKIHPLGDINKLNKQELREIYRSIKKTLKKGIELRGESIADFRDLEGKKGNFDEMRKVYRREGEKCSRCGASIRRVKIGGRSAHYCPTCQK